MTVASEPHIAKKASAAAKAKDPVSLNGINTNGTKQSYSDIKEAVAEVGKLLRIEGIADLLRLRSDEEAQAEVKAKLYAVEGFMNGIDAHLSRNSVGRVEAFLISQRLFDKAIKHADRIGVERLDEIHKKGFKHYIMHHQRAIKEELNREGDEKVKQIADQLGRNGNSLISKLAAKNYLRGAISSNRVQQYKWSIIGVSSYLIASASFVAGAHFDKVSDAFVALGGLLVGGGSHALLKAREFWQEKNIIKKIFKERYETK